VFFTLFIFDLIKQGYQIEFSLTLRNALFSAFLGVILENFNAIISSFAGKDMEF